MSAYCLFENLEITDAAKLETYKARVASVVELFGGRYVALGGSLRLLEGDWSPAPLVMIEFADVEHARRWYDSPEYAELKAMRHSAGRFNGVLLEGV
jgi:uncharacterized protein (DUF1330 family)